MKKKTVGAVASELLQKVPETKDPIEIQREVHKEYIDNLKVAVDRGLLTMKHDFYVVVIVKKEKLLENVLRNYFAERSTCPTPDYDQSVFKYLSLLHQIGQAVYSLFHHCLQHLSNLHTVHVQPYLL